MTVRQAVRKSTALVRSATIVRYASTQATTSQSPLATSPESTQRRRLKFAAHEVITFRESMEIIQRREARKSAQREAVRTITPTILLQ